jgi:hypothetical protein
MTPGDDQVETLDIRFVTDTAVGAGTPNTRLLIGGHDVTRFTSGVTFTCHVDQVNRVQVIFVAREGFAFAAPVGVAVVEIRVMPGFRLIQDTDGERVVYHAERIAPVVRPT